jgi:aldehyde dehydrogenase (NAD+)
MMQETPTISSNAARVEPPRRRHQTEAPAESQADRRLLIDGQLLETERTFPSINPGPAFVSGAAS